MKKTLRNDILLLLWLLLLAGAALLSARLFSSVGETVVITVDGKEYGSYPLNENRDINLDGNILVIKDGKADMIWADCPDKLCVNQSAISQVGESIICLPHKVVITVKGIGSADAVVK